MTDLTKKELASQLYDRFADRVDFLDKDLKTNHASYMDAAAQHANLVTDITKEVADAGWKVSPAVIDALCKGGADLMTMDLSEETIEPPAEGEPESEPKTDQDAPPPEGLTPASEAVDQAEQAGDQQEGQQQGQDGQEQADANQGGQNQGASQDGASGAQEGSQQESDPKPAG